MGGAGFKGALITDKGRKLFTAAAISACAKNKGLDRNDCRSE